MAFGKGEQSMMMSESILDSSNIMGSMVKADQGLDPSQMLDPKYIESRKIENLLALLVNESQIFLLNLVLGVRDPKVLKKIAKTDQEKIKEEQAQMVILALKALKSFSIDEVESNFNILQFMSESVLPYLFNDNPQIRNEAVLTFSSLKF